MKIQRNDPCHCDSGKKYKKCHIYLDQGLQKDAQGLWFKPAPKKTLEQIIGAGQPGMQTE